MVEGCEQRELDKGKARDREDNTEKDMHTILLAVWLHQLFSNLCPLNIYLRFYIQSFYEEELPSTLAFADQN